MRNDSYIQDLFWGQYKSRLECPNSECGRVSVTFDSYSHITLELPQESTVSLEVTMRFADKSLRPQRMIVKVGELPGVEGALQCVISWLVILLSATFGGLWCVCVGGVCFVTRDDWPVALDFDWRLLFCCLPSAVFGSLSLMSEM